MLEYLDDNIEVELPAQRIFIPRKNFFMNDALEKFIVRQELRSEFDKTKTTYFVVAAETLEKFYRTMLSKSCKVLSTYSEDDRQLYMGRKVLILVECSEYYSAKCDVPRSSNYIFFDYFKLTFDMEQVVRQQEYYMSEYLVAPCRRNYCIQNVLL